VCVCIVLDVARYSSDVDTVGSVELRSGGR